MSICDINAEDYGQPRRGRRRRERLARPLGAGSTAEGEHVDKHLPGERQTTVLIPTPATDRTDVHAELDSPTEDAKRGEEPSRRADRSGTRWMFVAAAILAVGLTLSVGGAVLWRSSVRAHNKQTFAATAADVTTTLETLLLRDADFVSTVRGVLTMEPRMSATRFERWFNDLQGRRRQLGGLGTAVVERVPVSELRTFQARRNADPAFRSLVGGRPRPFLRNGRSVNCLLSASVSVAGALSQGVTGLLQDDWCSRTSGVGITQARLLRAETDTGRCSFYPSPARECAPCSSSRRSTAVARASPTSPSAAPRLPAGL
jgi:hypothetical protein